MSQLQFPPTSLSPGERDWPAISLPPPSSTRGHQRSRTTVERPPLFTRSASSSPTRSSTFLPFRKTIKEGSPEPAPSTLAASECGDSDTSARPRTGTVSKIASWFDGSSEPVNISFVPSPKREQADPFYHVQSPEDYSMHQLDNLTQRPTKKSGTQSNTANSSRFSFFKRAAPVQTTIDPDELVQMDIQEALSPELAEEITPEAYNTLRHNAEQLLKKFQLSYAENLGALRQITSAKNIQTDELDAAQTRNEHLKLQLLEMAERGAEHERTIASLREELNKHQQSIRMISEDEPDTPRSWRRNRRSDFSSTGDSMSDSDMSSAVSIFSDADSIRTPATSAAPSPVIKHARLHNPIYKLGASIPSQTTPVLMSHCSNCHGVPASEAWDVVSILKMESVGLKQRVAELENAQDAALDFLSGLSM